MLAVLFFLAYSIYKLFKMNMLEYTGKTLLLALFAYCILLSLKKLIQFCGENSFFS